MNFLLTGGAVFRDGTFQNVDVAISKGRIVSVSPSLSQEGFSVIECQDQVIVPGFVDVHVHLREPGFSYTETIASGTAAAAAGSGPVLSVGQLLRCYPAYTWLLVGCALLMACHSATCTYMIHIVGKVGGSESMMGSALAVAAFLELPAMGLFSRVRRKVPLAWLLIFCAVFFVIRAGLFWAARSVPVLYLAAALDFFEYGIFIPATVYYVAEHIDPANQVKGQSLMGMATTGVGSAFGNFVSGQLLDRTGVNGMLLFCTICATVGLLVVIYAVRKK